MALERVPTPEFNLIVGDNWPELDETTYAARAAEQFKNSQQLADGAATVTNMASAVDANMEGQTAAASEAQSLSRFTNLTAQGTTQANRAGGLGLAAQNILNAKTELNAIATGYETEWEAIKTQAVAEGWDQAQLQEAKDALVDEFKGQADTTGANFEQADTALKEQIVAGAEPSVPPSMPGGSGGLELPPELSSQMQSMLGQGMGMAQSLPQSLQGAVAPLGEQGQQALDKVLQAVQGGSGNVNVTPEMLDEMLAGQDSGSGDSGSGDSGSGSADEGAETETTDDGFKGENTGAADATPVSMSTGGGEAGAANGGSGSDGGAETAMMSGDSAPSPADTPVTAAPPASAAIPETQLSGDSGASAPSGGTDSSPQAGGAGGTGGAAANGFRGDDQGVTRQAPVTDSAAGTHLTSDTMTAPANAAAGAGSLGTTGLSGAGAGGLGAGGLGGGLGAGMGAGGLGGGMGAGAMGGVGAAPMAGAPASLAPTPPAPMAAAPAPAAPAPAGAGASVPTAGTAPSSPTMPGAPATAGAAGAAALSQPAGVSRDGGTAGIVPAAVPAGGYSGAVQHMSGAAYTDAERRVGTIAAAVTTAFTRAGVVTPIAVALLRDGTSVFTTADGIGVLPHNVALPEDVIPLAEIAEVNDLFRQDMTGCVNPGYVLKTVVDIGLIEFVRAIVATDNGTTEGVTYVSSEALKGAPSLPLVVHRDQFAGVDPEDISDAIDAVRTDWGITEKPSLEDALLNLTLARWETVSDPAASKVLATWMVTDAEDSLAKGRVGEAAYVLMQAMRLGVPQG